MLEFTKEQKNQIEELYKSGMNIRKVSKELKINSKRVNDYLRGIGALKTTRLTKDELDVLRNKIKELYLSGKRISEIEKDRLRQEAQVTPIDFLDLYDEQEAKIESE